ncbi:unnamed protein product [Ectocarpus sp. CCAP 1310/34]|nr:unnamed protein product [Ectocarpus sp. CCAP 1310/34]
MPAAAQMTTSSTSTSPSSSSAPPLIPLLPETIGAAAKRSKKNPRVPSEMPALELHPTVGEYPVDYTMHAENRAKVINRLRETDGVAPRGVLLLRGGLAANRDETDHEPVFRQESTFHYLFGVREPDCLATIDLETGKATLFIPRLPAVYATWMGEILPPKHFQDVYKVDQVLFVDELASTIKKGQPQKVYLNKGYNTDGKAWSAPASVDGLDGLETDSSTTLYDAIVECRVIKTKKEIDIMQHITNLSSEAHFEVMRRTRPGMREYQLESMFRHWVYYNGGCRHTAYTSICGCGPNSAVLHYGHAGAPNDRTIGENDMLLLDMGGEYHCYASDITCSFPANGKFTADQKMIFEAVRDMAFAVMDAMKPGVSWPSLHELSYRVACERLKDAGLLTGSVDDMMAANVGAVFMPHGLGHLIGLDTHDVGGYPEGGRARDPRPGHSSLRCGRDLADGMAITVEPGIYFIDHLLDKALKDPEASVAPFLVKSELARFRGFGGVRLEDDVVVTADGVRNLTNCARTVEDVEAVMAGRITNRNQLFKKCYTDA